jgi:hypothetical protein
MLRSILLNAAGAGSVPMALRPRFAGGSERRVWGTVS